MLNNKIISSRNDYDNATPWDKLKFVAQAKHNNGKHVVELKEKHICFRKSDFSEIKVRKLEFAR